MSEEKWVIPTGYGVQYHPLPVYSYLHVIQTDNGSNITAVAVSNNTLHDMNTAITDTENLFDQ